MHTEAFLTRIDARAWALARRAYEWYRKEMLSDPQIASGTQAPEDWTPDGTEFQSLSTLARHLRVLEAQQLILRAGYENVQAEGRRLAAEVGVDWSQYHEDQSTAARGG